MVAFQALSLPKPEQDILFVDADPYVWGILDEVVSTAFSAGKFHLGLQAADRLLNENLLPPEHIERVQKNRQSYYNKVLEIQAHMAQQQYAQAQMQAKIQAPVVPQTTLNLPKKMVTLSSKEGVYGQEEKQEQKGKSFKKKKVKK
jgi:hypothetical protein